MSSNESYRKGMETMEQMLGEKFIARRAVNMKGYPDWDKYAIEVLYGDVWNRPVFDKKTRSLITVAALLVLGRDNELRIHLTAALRNGVTRDEIVELMLHLAFYGGFPVTSTGLNIAREIFRESGLEED